MDNLDEKSTRNISVNFFNCGATKLSGSGGKPYFPFYNGNLAIEVFPGNVVVYGFL
jgi:hypothetical protein